MVYPRPSGGSLLICWQTHVQYKNTHIHVITVTKLIKSACQDNHLYLTLSIRIATYGRLNLDTRHRYLLLFIESHKINTPHWPRLLFLYKRFDFDCIMEKQSKRWKTVSQTAVGNTLPLTWHSSVGPWFAVFYIAEAQQLGHVNRSRFLVNYSVNTKSPV